MWLESFSSPQVYRCAGLLRNEAIVRVVAHQVHHDDCKEAADDEGASDNFVLQISIHVEGVSCSRY